MAKRVDHGALIEQLGGMNGVAKALGVTKPNTIAHWKKPGRGIPPIYWPAIERLARAHGLDISCADLEAGSPHPRGARDYAAAE